jgi:hypothetical protein
MELIRFHNQEDKMKKKLPLILSIIVIALLIAPAISAADPALVIPTFTITAVDEDDTVSIKAQNFPAGDSFKVTMGLFGTKGVGGVFVTNQNSGTGSFTATYDIPASLAGLNQIAIRLQSPTSGYYSYNWFWNNDAPDGGGDPPIGTTWSYPLGGAASIPHTTITDVTTSVDVTVDGTNFTRNDTYNVYIGKFGTKGVGGVKVDTFDTDGTGKFTKTFSIPASLEDEGKLAIRFQSPNSGYYAYDWFVNTGVVVPPGPGGTWGYPPAGANTIPTFTIQSVVEDSKVTIKATNFTTDDTFYVYMGKFGTKGVGGVKVEEQTTDGTGAFTATYDIPASLHGLSMIAIRLQSPASGYYSYNWFYNNDAP